MLERCVVLNLHIIIIKIHSCVPIHKGTYVRIITSLILFIKDEPSRERQEILNLYIEWHTIREREIHKSIKLRDDEDENVPRVKKLR